VGGPRQNAPDVNAATAADRGGGPKFATWVQYVPSRSHVSPITDWPSLPPNKTHRPRTESNAIACPNRAVGPKSCAWCHDRFHTTHGSSHDRQRQSTRRRHRALPLQPGACALSVWLTCGGRRLLDGVYRARAAASLWSSSVSNVRPHVLPRRFHLSRPAAPNCMGDIRPPRLTLLGGSAGSRWRNGRNRICICKRTMLQASSRAVLSVIGLSCSVAGVVRLGKRSSPGSAPTSWLLGTRSSHVEFGGRARRPCVVSVARVTAATNVLAASIARLTRARRPRGH
jgi:hypothetical protein